MDAPLLPRRRRVNLCLLSLALCGACSAADWPQFLGPARNGIAPKADLAATWPKEGPRIVWKRKVGQGFSGPAVLGDKVILFHRPGDRETVECLDRENGNTLWSFDYPSRYVDDFGFDEGPRATPAIHEPYVVTFGAEGALHCLDLNTGAKIWSVSTREAFGAPKGFFGMACSPLIHDGRVLLNIGGRDQAGIVAYRLSDGALLWKASEDEASYSSPVVAEIGGKPHALFFTRNGLVSLNPVDGRQHFAFPWRSRSHASVNAATPLVVGNDIFLSASYGTGAVLLRVNGTQLQKIWSSDESLSSHYATPVYHEGFLYGFHGRQETGPSFRCVELRTGKVRWSDDSFPAGTVTLAGKQLLLLLEDGRLAIAPADPAAFRPSAQAQILPFGVRAYPALSDGFLYARSKDQLICVDLRKPGTTGTNP